MAAFVGALLCQVSDRTAWLAALLGDRFQNTGQLVVAATVALSVSNVIGAAAGQIIAPMMTPNARALFIALALVSAGGAALFRSRRPGDMARSRIGALATALISLLAISIGDRTQFLTAALATRSTLPVFAAIGATLGSLVVVIPAMLAGEAQYRSLPHRPLRIGSGLILIFTGVIFGLGALRLI